MIIQNTKRLPQNIINSLFGRSTFFCGNFKNYSTQTDENPRRKSRLLFKSGAVLGLGTVLFGGLVWYDDRVRKIIEENVPYSKVIFNNIFETIDEKSKKINIDQLTNFFGKDSPSILSSKNIVDDNGKLKLTSISDLTSKSSTETLKDAKTNVASADSIIPVEVCKPVNVETVIKDEPTDIIVDNEFELQIIESLKMVTEKSTIAKDAKLKTIGAIQKHLALIKEASEPSFINEINNDSREKIDKASAQVEECSKNDSILENIARKAIDSLKTQINESRLDPKKASSPALTNSIETVKKLSLRLDELNLRLDKERSQINVLFNLMELSQKGRQQFERVQDSSAFSNISQNIGEKMNENKSLTEQELNAHIIHANMKIDQLKKQLEELQLKDDKTILETLEKQRSIDEKFAKLHVDIELQKAKENESQMIDEKKQEFRKEWEAEVDARLRHVSLAHAEHLEKVIRTQKQLHDIENAQILEEVVTIERNKFAKQIELSLERLNEIEKALNSRTAQDLENRRSKIFWSICQNLLDSLIGSKNSKYFTNLNEIKLISILGEHDDFVQTICNCFPKEIVNTSIQTEEGLKSRFEKVHKVARRTAQIGENGGSPFDYFLSWLQSLFVLQIATAKYSLKDKIDIDNYEPYELLNKIKYFVKIGDLKNAVRLANLLRGESAQIFQDWIYDAQLHLEARFLAELLLLHSQITSIRTTY